MRPIFLYKVVSHYSLLSNQFDHFFVHRELKVEEEERHNAHQVQNHAQIYEQSGRNLPLAINCFLLQATQKNGDLWDDGRWNAKTGLIGEEGSD